MILDTAYVVDLMQGDAGAVKKATGMEERGIQQQISSMTVFELYQGIERAVESENERERVREVVGSKPVVPADDAVMRKAGRLHGRLTNRGEPIEEGDCVIAATAIVHDEPVLTRNVDHFERVDGVTIRSY